MLLTFEAQKQKRSSFIVSQSRDDIWMGGLSLFPSNDYPEYQAPSKHYENGPIAYFEKHFPVFQDRTVTLRAHPDDLHMYAEICEIRGSPGSTN